MSLQGQSPLRVIQAVPDRGLRIFCPLRRIHWLQEEMLEFQCFEIARLRFGLDLRVDELQLVAPGLCKRLCTLRAYA